MSDRVTLIVLVGDEIRVSVDGQFEYQRSEFLYTDEVVFIIF